MEQILGQVIGGALGGARGGKVVKGSDMGGLGNILAGALGGLGGGQILGGMLNSGAADMAASGLDIGALAANLAANLGRWRDRRCDRAGGRRPDPAAHARLIPLAA